MASSLDASVIDIVLNLKKSRTREIADHHNIAKPEVHRLSITGTTCPGGRASG
jgi:hypothetical protein